ncbi:MAG: sugar ABC transporter permease, partial [Candidatus Kapabacteria bacterium]|nr:sugar ABC transporter permease [Candidatus Kapabacteria bacterium]
MKMRSCLQQQYWDGMLFMVPWLVTFVLFWLYPLAEAFLLSLSNYSTLTGVRQWVGLANYHALIDDPLFWQALKNTVIFTAGTVPLTTTLALMLAVMLDRVAQGWFASLLRAAYFLPTVTSLVVVSLIFTNLYARDGYINALLQALQLPYPERGWLLDPRTALGSIMA